MNKERINSRHSEISTGVQQLYTPVQFNFRKLKQ